MSQLTPLELNQQIVNMRRIVHLASVRLARHLIRQIKKLNEKGNEKALRKVIRLEEELKSYKEIDRDSISKFALLNTKNLQELNIRGSTPSDQRVVFKLSIDKVVVNFVEKFRKNFPEWRTEVPFLLQRLGLQYQKRKKKLDKFQTITEPDDNGEPLETVEREKRPTNLEKRKRKQAVSKLVKDEIKIALKNENKSIKVLKKSLKMHRDEQSELPLPEIPKNLLPSQRITRGEAVIESLDLTNAIEDGSSPIELNFNETLDDKDKVDVGLGENRADHEGTADHQTVEPRKVQIKANHKMEKLTKRKNPSDFQRSEAFDSVDTVISKKVRKSRDQTSKAIYVDITSKANNADKCDIHPSWSAKIRERENRKLLERIRPKKTVFEDD